MNRDRYGEPIDVDDQAAAVVELPHHCDDGWLDRDADNPVPCLRCRPHLAPQPRPPKPDPTRIHAGVRTVLDALADRARGTEGQHTDRATP